MYGIASTSKEALAVTVEDMFDRIALQLIGNLPKYAKAKRLLISTEPNFGLSHLFLQAMGSTPPNALEKDVLKSLLESASGYVDSLKSKTKSAVVERVDGLVRQAQLQKRKVTDEEVRSVLSEEFQKASNHIRLIAEAEGTKIRNMGSMLKISKVAGSLGDSDPTVFFIIVKSSACPECVRVHTLDGTTPRLFKLSEVSHAFHKRDQDSPSICGLHPNCHCQISYLSRSFGFDSKGKIKYHSQGFDAYSAQR